MTGEKPAAAGGSALEIRPFLVEDTEAVVALWQVSDLVRPWNDPHRDIARKQTMQPELFLVGLLEGRLVATVMAGYEGHRGWVNYLAVDPGHRRRGLARRLMTEVEERLLALGCPKINLQVRSTNLQAIRFYEHIGFLEDDVVSLGKRLIPDP
jgi:ribosomal protein S18 acetylase RimI-like enzyme